MGLQRTREQKQNPHHNFVLSWNPGPTYARVNGQKNIGQVAKITQATAVKKADLTAEVTQTRNTKRAIVRSLILISLILCLELVVYSLWNVRR